VLFESLMLATMTSLASPSPTLGSAALSTRMWAPRVGAYLTAVQAPWLQLTPLQLLRSCKNRLGKRSAPCLAALAAPIAVALPALMRRRRGPTVPQSAMGGTLGGVKSYDVMDSEHVSAGPQLSWLTPDSPREELLRLRVVAPGWAVRYTWEEAHVSVGVAAFTRFVMFGEDMPVVDMLTSEARIEIELP
jgi:hypothetical protein